MKKTNEFFESVPLMEEEKTRTTNPFPFQTPDFIETGSINPFPGSSIPQQTVIGNFPFQSTLSPMFTPYIPLNTPFTTSPFTTTPFATSPHMFTGFPFQQAIYPTPFQPTYFYNAPTSAIPQHATFAGQPLSEKNPLTQTWINKNGEKDFSSWIPSINILETDKFFRIELGVPGVTKENCKIGVEGNILWVSGTRPINREKDNLPVNLTRKEFNYGSFYRSFLLTENLETGKIMATCQNGMLTINIPKKDITKKSAAEISIT